MLTAMLTPNPQATPTALVLAQAAALDADLALLAAHRQAWVDTSVAERTVILQEIKDALMPVAEAWAMAASRKKGIAVNSPLEGEE